MDESSRSPVLYTIALSIAASADLETMLDAALFSFKQNLSLSACGVLFFKVDSEGNLFLETKHSVPSDHRMNEHYESAMRFLLSEEKDADIRSIENRLPLSILDRKGTHIYLYSLPYVGVLVLEKKGEPFGKELMFALQPLSEKLASACAACIRNRELEMITESTQTINREYRLAEKKLFVTIGEMQRTQDELDSSRKHLALILQSLGEGVIVADKNGLVKMINVKALEYLDFMPEEAEQITLQTLFEKSTKGSLSLLDLSVPGEVEQIPCEMTVVNRWKEERQIRVVPNRLESILEGEGETIFLVQDVTREKELDRMKNEFISNLSHEMRTPMNAILGISRIILLKNSENLNPRQTEGLSLIYDSGKRLLSLINDILDLSKIEAGKMDILPAPFSLENLLLGIKAFVGPLSSDSVSFSLSVDSSVPPVVDADENRIRQVLINLLGNSFKFTEKGNVLLEVSAKEGFLHFMVSDTGIGIAKMDIPHLFERFRQVDGSSSRRFQGTGIGLSLSRDLVRLMGGSISVTSEEGKGTSMSFSVAYRESVNAESDILSDHLSAAKTAKDKKRILVVDDELTSRETLMFILSDRYDMAAADSGPAALELIDARKPDLVLLDIMMSGMDGFAVLDEIRKRETEFRIPVVAVTARAMKGEKEMILSRGFDGYVSKPVDEAVLVELIQSHIGGEDCNE